MFFFLEKLKKSEDEDLKNILKLCIIDEYNKRMDANMTRIVTECDEFDVDGCIKCYYMLTHIFKKVVVLNDDEDIFDTLALETQKVNKTELFAQIREDKFKIYLSAGKQSEFDSIINKVLMVNDLHPIVLEKMGGYAISDNTFHLFNMIMYTREYIPKLNGLALNSKELALYLLLLNETFENDSVTINEAKSYKKMYFEEKDEREKNQFTRMKNLIMLVNH